MKIQEAILESQEIGTNKIRESWWLGNIFAYVENGYVSIHHNEQQTGEPYIFSIEDLLSEEWEVIQPEELIKCPSCHYLFRKG